MKYTVSTSLSAARELEQLQDTLFGYPSAGVHVGGGRHVPMPATWDGTGAVPPGWSSYLGATLKHPTLSQWATMLDDSIAAALADARGNRLTGPQKTTLAAANAAAVATLPAGWGGAAKAAR